jgi:hypothetical protein
MRARTGCTPDWVELSFCVCHSYPEGEKAGILADVHKHRPYEKPSERGKRKMDAARRKTRRTHPA